jgi:hypothetical protein
MAREGSRPAILCDRSRGRDVIAGKDTPLACGTPSQRGDPALLSLKRFQ